MEDGMEDFWYGMEWKISGMEWKPAKMAGIMVDTVIKIVSTIIPAIFIFTSFFNAQQHSTVDRTQVATLL